MVDNKNIPLLEMNGITKRFPGVVALNNVDLQLNNGEVLALLGENGAGKSTLLKILAGAYMMDSGEIYIEGQKQNFKNPLDAFKVGISVIYQELNYFNDLTIAENIFVGRMPKNKFGLIDLTELYSLSKKVLGKMGLDINPKLLMNSLATAERQMIEIAKAISKEMKILVMDEPTAALNDVESENLIKTVKNLASSGIGIIYISHRIEELFLVSDKIEVLRDGEKIGVYDTRNITRDKLVKAMVGRTISDMYPKRDIKIRETVLEVKGLTNEYIKDISFSVRAGEILGVFGLLGSGRTKLCEALFGIKSYVSGSITINGESVKIKSPSHAKKVGLAYVPSARKIEGLILIQTVRENFSTAIIDKLSKYLLIRKKIEEKNAKKWVKNLSVITPGIETAIESLSGGNQQKVVIGKWLETEPKVIILNDPTRGVDVGAKVEIYNIIGNLCEQGMGVIFISSEQPEILALSDRIIVMSEGRLTGKFSKEEFSAEKILYSAIRSR